jgi:hypothetical protein
LNKYDGSGSLLWSQQIGTVSDDYSHSVALDTFGNAYLSGSTGGSLGGPNAGLNSNDAFLTKYDSAGSLLWSQQIGTSSSDWNESVAVDAIGNAYIGGSTWGSLGGPNAGSSDAFLVKFSPIPEPSTFVTFGGLLGMGAIGLLLAGRRRNRAA